MLCFVAGQLRKTLYGFSYVHTTIIALSEISEFGLNSTNLKYNVYYRNLVLAAYNHEAGFRLQRKQYTAVKFQ